MSKNPLNDLGESLGEYLRDQRRAARLSLRQLSELAGVSNPYLSQIERGLKRPSAEILQQLAKGLEVSAESLYVRAGILDERREPAHQGLDTRAAINADRRLTDRQKVALLDIYDSFVGGHESSGAPEPRKPAARKPTTRRSTTTSASSAKPTKPTKPTKTTKTRKTPRQGE